MTSVITNLKKNIFIGFFVALSVISAENAKSQTTITVGASGYQFTTIQAAYNSIPSSLSGAYIIAVESNYASTGESFPITFTARSGASTSNTITIEPASAVGSITSTCTSTTSPFFLLNGATYITIDGRAGGAGSTNAWTIENSASEGAPCIELENGANYNNIQYLNIYGAGGNTPTEGIVYLLCNSSGPDNTNDLIQYCNIGHYEANSAYIPENCILAYGNGSHKNSYITVQYNSIHDFWNTYIAGSYIGCGVCVSGTGTSSDYGDNWTITGNSFYRTELQNNGYGQEAPIYFAPSPTSSTATSTGNTISNNYIGGNASALANSNTITGMYSTWEAKSGNPSVTFAGIEVFAKSVNITGNIISNIQLFQENSFDGFVGIFVPQGTSGGTINIQNNTIGSSYGAGKQYYVYYSTSSNTLGTGTKTFSVPAGLSYAGGEPVMMVWRTYENGCGCYGYMLGTVTSYSGTTLTVNSTSQFDGGTGTDWAIGISKGIWNDNNGFMTGIWTGANNMAGTMNITGNTIGNLTSAIGYYNEVAGILTQNGNNTITGNNIFNLETEMTNVSSGSSGNTLAIQGCIAGISQQSTASGVNTVSNNNVYNLYNISNASGTANLINGIELNGPSGSTQQIENANYVAGLLNNNSASATTLNGIAIYSGTHLLTNNMVNLGISYGGSSVTASSTIQGIADIQAGSAGNGIQKFYFNSVYIGGSGVSGGASTYSFKRTNSSSDDKIDLRNNILVNNRSGGTGYNYNVGLDNSNNLTSSTENYNDCFGNGANYVLGHCTSNCTSYSNLQTQSGNSNFDVNSITSNPNLANPTGSAKGASGLDIQSGSPATGAGQTISGITKDFWGTTRANPPCIGADEIIICNSPTASINQGNQTLCAGNNLTFSVTATGTSTLSYQWIQNSNEISGATNTQYSINNIQLSNAGSFSCLVSNNCGSATSNSVTLIVNTPAGITGITANQARCSGDTVSFKIIANGTANSYQWKLNGNNISAATNSLYSINKATVADSGYYNCILTNSCNSITSNNISLKINTPLKVTYISPYKYKCPGDTAIFITDVTGSPVNYQWTFNGDNIYTATDYGIFFGSIDKLDSGTYTCEVSNLCSDTVVKSYMNVFKPAVIDYTKSTVTNQNVCTGGTITFTASATGDNLSYQWLQGGSNLTGATNSSYTITDADINDNDIYSCNIDNECSSVNLPTFILNLFTVPVISISVVKDHVNEGDTLKYLVSPTGANTFTYQWFQNGNLINGATEYTFIIKGIVASDTGLYTCQITDTCGTKMYNIAYVYINSLIHNITGYVVYDNVTQTPLSKIWVYLYQGETKLDSSETDSTGAYKLSALNGTYTLTCSSKLGWGGANPLDALVVNRYFIGAIKITDALKLLAADVNDDKKVNPLDALLINRRFISVIKRFTISDWLFSTTTIQVSNSNLSQNIKAICAGDVEAADKF